jgi:hypothetical protein
MGWIAKAIDAGRGFRNPLSDVADGLFVDIGDTRPKVSQFWMLLAPRPSKSWRPRSAAACPRASP